jgi:hypothetical protein
MTPNIPLLDCFSRTRLSAMVPEGILRIVSVQGAFSVSRLSSLVFGGRRTPVGRFIFKGSAVRHFLRTGIPFREDSLPDLYRSYLIHRQT